MAGRESFFWHKLHSLTGIIPVGFYMVQHLTLNSFTLAGPDAYNGVIQFFEHLPFHVLVVLKYGIVWLPLLFHAIYGFMIYSRADFYQSPQAAQYRENKMFIFQRWSGAFAFVFLCYHMTTTSVAGALKGPENVIYYDRWASHLASFGYAVLIFYMLGILTCAYHLSYGIWNFCIRWGITISEAAQSRVAKFSGAFCVLLTLLGWVALAGFFVSPLKPSQASAIPIGEHETRLYAPTPGSGASLGH